jgi:hypothetical protein
MAPTVRKSIPLPPNASKGTATWRIQDAGGPNDRLLSLSTASRIRDNSQATVFFNPEA